MRKRLIVAASALILVSCQRGGDLPALQLDSLTAAVRRTLQGALDTAKANPDRASAAGQLGKLLLAQGFTLEAQACFDRARRLDPGSSVWPYYAGVIYQDSKDFSNAKKAFEEHLHGDAGSFAGTVRLAETLFGLGDKAASLERFAAAIGKRPSSARACYGMGLLLQTQGKLEDAGRFYERALAAFPRYRNARFALATTWRERGNTAKAEEILEGYDATRGRGDAQVVPFDDPLMAEIHRMDVGPQGTRLRAQQLARSGKVVRAAQLLEAALRQDPKQTGYRSDLMMYYTHLEKWEKAEEMYRAMVNENPDNAVAHSQRGELLTARGKCEEAVEAFDTALQIDAALAMAHQGLGECQMTLKRYASAEAHFRKALATDPDSAKAHGSLGLVLVETHRYAEAMSHLLTAKDEAHGRDQARILFALGTAYQDQGSWNKALDAYENSRVLAEAYGPASLLPAIARSAPELSRRAARH